ncbi:MAG: pilus assembly protein N-terminal domain-containing protein [Pirellulaceae bacterium]|nr:pilus assembly protein N-terminal domain-containing protein [Pirellulaceae bacterium]
MLASTQLSAFGAVSDTLSQTFVRRKSLFVPVLILAVAVASPVWSQQNADRGLDPVTRDKIDDVIDDVFEPEAVLRVPLRQSKLIRTKLDIKRVSAADPAIVDIVAFDTREIELIGKGTGTTTVTLWLGTGAEARLLSVLVKVEADRTVNERRRLEYGELQGALNELFPGSKLRLFPIADKIIVTGQARDAEEAEQILAVVRSRGTMGGHWGWGGHGSISAQGAAAEPFPDASQLPQSGVVSLLRIPGEQQVMLRVRIAELNRTAARSMGVDLEGSIKDFLFSSTLAGSPNLFLNGTFSEASFGVAISALEQHGVAKILAEPNLVTLSGQTATFLAGGEFPVPTVVGVDGVGAATTEFKGFGAQLTFTPTVLDKDRIRLQVAPQFSSLSEANSVNGIFGLNTRSAVTTVDLREGQVLAIAGLIADQQEGARTRIPFFGALPGVGVLFANKQVTRSETELLIVVTPEIVSPLEPCDAPTLLPGMEVTEPNDFDLYLRNQIEGREGHHYRSTVWPVYRDRMLHPHMHARGYQASEGYFMNGPSGLSQ